MFARHGFLRRLIAFVIVEDTEIRFVNHMVIAFDISCPACVDDILRNISGIVRFEQIVFVVPTDVRVFGSDIYSFYAGSFFLDFGYDFKTQVIKIASAAK